MTVNETRPRSVWLADAPRTNYTPLREGVTADVAVVGGGITGLTAAILLQRAGMQVVLVEANRIGCGVTGHTTAKLTSLHKLIYAKLEQDFDQEAARTYATANQSGLRQIEALVAELNIDCRLETQPAITYTREDSHVEEIREEVEAARRAGLPASFTTESELPFEIRAAIRVEDQAQFHPYAYCVGLAEAFVHGGGRIFEQSWATNVEEAGDGAHSILKTRDGEVHAKHVLLATLLPFLDRGGFFARAFPSRSYGLAVRLVTEAAPRGMYICVEAPTRSVRPMAERDAIIVVGENHKVGQDADTRQRYRDLESWARQWFPVRSIEYHWSSQDFMSADRLPFIGRLHPGAERVYVATGFNKWGLTTGTFAAMILADLIQGRANPWAELFDSTRVSLAPSAKKLITENANVAKRYVGDRLKALLAPKLSELPRGQGAIVTAGGDKVAAYRDENGAVEAVSPICTHMGCYVEWNSAERSWDCPCHGSRFGTDGSLLQGPAVEPLSRCDVTES